MERRGGDRRMEQWLGRLLFVCVIARLALAL